MGDPGAVFYLCPHCDRGQQLWQPRLPRPNPAPSAPRRQPPAPEQSRRTARPLWPAAGVSATPGASARSSATGLPRWAGKRPGVWLCCRVCGGTGRCRWPVAGGWHEPEPPASGHRHPRSR